MFRVLLSTTASAVSTFEPDSRASISDQFVQFVGAAGSDAANPAEERTSNNRRMEKQPHQVESAHP